MKITRQAKKKTQIITKTGFNSLSIIQHPQARFSVGFQKHLKTKKIYIYIETWELYW